MDEQKVAATAENNDDVCDACGCVAEIGVLIRENDSVFSVELTGDSVDAAKASADKLIAAAQEQYGDTCQSQVKVLSEGAEAKVELLIEFSCTAEKLIFEMNARHVKW